MTLKLGPLPRTETFKVNINLPVQLKEQLEFYAQLHSAAWNEVVDGPTLIPHILALFLSKDRTFRKALKSRKP